MAVVVISSTRGRHNFAVVAKSLLLAESSHKDHGSYQRNTSCIAR